jgi:nucleobase:cation symporter-1, NCS1 family
MQPPAGISGQASSPRLLNDDLAPSTSRTWGAYSITSVWFGVVHNIGNYTLAAGMLLVGLPAWQVVIGLFIGFLLSYVGCQMMGRAGQRYGVPYPVIARASFGVFGANLPALIRAVVAIAWYGIQTYLASRAVIVLLIAIWPGLAHLTHGGLLGLSPLGWMAFLGLWAAQLFVVTHGMETIRKFQNYAGAVISLVMLVLAIVITVQAGGHIDWGYGAVPMSFGARINSVLTVGCLMFIPFVTLLLNVCDFSRFSPDQRAVTKGNFWGLPVNGLAFILLVVICTVGGHSVYGRMFTDPTDLLAAGGNPVLIAVGAVMFVFATMGVNIIANVISPAYDLANVFPKAIDFRRGALITSWLALLVMPWKLYESTATIQYFLGSLGAVLGPLFGIMMVDYYWLRRGNLAVASLYSEDPAGPYFYRKGVNPKAVAAFVPASVLSILLALLPQLHSVSAYGWFLGSGFAALVYRAAHPASARRAVTVAAEDPAGPARAALALKAD